MKQFIAASYFPDLNRNAVEISHQPRSKEYVDLQLLIFNGEIFLVQVLTNIMTEMFLQFGRVTAGSSSSVKMDNYQDFCSWYSITILVIATTPARWTRSMRSLCSITACFIFNRHTFFSYNLSQSTTDVPLILADTDMAIFYPTNYSFQKPLSNLVI